MSRMHDAILGILEDELRNRPLWGEPPGLHVLRLSRAEPSLVELSVPGFLWKDDPAAKLAFLAGRMEQHDKLVASLIPADFHGMAFRTEGWALKGTPDDDPAVMRAKLAAARQHVIKHRRDRIECRILNAVDRAGNAYHVMLERDGDLHSFIAYAGSREGSYCTGTTFSALDRIVAACGSLTLPPRRPRPDWLRG